jgi:antitoxin ParD1/3/4
MREEMDIRLSPELEKLVADKIASGRYASPDEVIHEALRLLEREEMSRNEKIEEFNRELQTRIASADRGQYVTAEDSRRHSQEKSASRRAALRLAELGGSQPDLDFRVTRRAISPRPRKGKRP